MVRVWLDRQAFEEMVTLSREKAPLETGGMLCGYWSTDRSHVVITHIIGPGPNAVHKWDRFRHDDKGQQPYLEAIWNKYDGAITFLGDWHTHPDYFSIQSELDKETHIKLSQYEPARVPNALMLILGHDFSIEAARLFIVLEGRICQVPSVTFFDFKYDPKAEASNG